MRSRRFAVVVALALPLVAAAQLPVQGAPEPGRWYQDTMGLWGKARPAEKALLALKPGTVDASLKDDLARVDWLQPGAWSFPEQKFGPGYASDRPSNLQFVRHDPVQGDLTFQYTAPPDSPTEGHFTHLNFEVPTHTFTRLVDVKGAPYLEVTAFGAKEVHRVVSYAQGVLVIDISYDGKPDSKKVKFRDVRLALPRSFEWKAPRK